MLGPGRGIGSRLLHAGALLGVHRLGVDLYRGLFQRAVPDIAVLSLKMQPQYFCM